jgi:acyl dehydratase
MSEHYLEDLQVGQTFSSGHLCVDKERAKEFAAEFDQQPFQLDEQPARYSVCGGWPSAVGTARQ